MTIRFAASVASAATAILLLGACGDDGPTTLAQGAVEFVAPHGRMSLDITAVEEDGEVSGEARFDVVVVGLECADTESDGLVILGGEVTTPSGDFTPAIGDLIAVLIREGDPDRLTLWFDEGESGTCEELLESIPPEDVLIDDGAFVEVEGDIETG